MVMILPIDATFKRLVWTDFATRQISAPAPGATATAAMTAVNMAISPNVFHFQPASFLKQPNFKLTEDPNVTVTLDAPRMWVASWVFSSPPAFQVRLLNHEQGHYEISMLNAVDIFHELNSIQIGAFADARAGANAINGMQTQLFDVQRIHNKYDTDTSHGVNLIMQTSWNTALLNARVTFVRPALRTALANAGLFP